MKKNAPFRSRISKLIKTFVENAEDLEIAMLIYNLEEYGYKYSMTSESLRNYYKDEVNYDAHEIVANHKIKNKQCNSK